MMKKPPRHFKGFEFIRYKYIELTRIIEGFSHSSCVLKLLAVYDISLLFYILFFLSQDFIIQSKVIMKLYTYSKIYIDCLLKYYH